MKNEYEKSVKAEAEALLGKHSVAQLAFADWLYVYAVDCDDEKAKAKWPACADWLDAQRRLWDRFDPDGELYLAVDDDLRRACGVPGDNAETMRMLNLDGFAMTAD